MTDRARGHHKVFLGMTAGVGTTCRALQELRVEYDAGRDVVIGYVEPHARHDAEARACGLPQIGHRRVPYRNVALDELNLAALLARRPALVLIDDLAHTNPPGTEHGKRYEDVEVALAAGIDVYSTVNVEQLESIADEVAELTGVRVRETLPDRVLSAADEVVLVDLIPPTPVERLRADQAGAPVRLLSALSGCVRDEQLEALREVVLRQLAEDVGRERLREVIVRREDRLRTRGAPPAVVERLLALVTLQPSSQRVVRRAWHFAQRLGAELDVLTVLSPTRNLSAEECEQLEALYRLSSVLGVTVFEEHGDVVADVVARVVREHGTTDVLMGPPQPRSGVGRFTEPLVDGLVRRMPGVDVRILSDRSKHDRVQP